MFLELFSYYPVKPFNKKVLPATGLKCGTNSSEYEQLGGAIWSGRSERQSRRRRIRNL